MQILGCISTESMKPLTSGTPAVLSPKSHLVTVGKDTWKMGQFTVPKVHILTSFPGTKGEEQRRGTRH